MKIKILVNAILAIPIMLVVIWIGSVCLVGAGFVIPYLVLAEFYSFGFWRILIYGSLINLAFCISAGLLFLSEDFIDPDIYLPAGLVQIVLIVVCMLGYNYGWSW